MPQLLLIAASGTAQRRLLEETSAALKKDGYTAAGKQEGGEWRSLLSDNMTGGLFDEKRFIVVESAGALGPFPENLASLVEPSSDAALLLVYESDARMQPARFIPKEILSKCRVIKAAEFPRWPRERGLWTARLAKEMDVPISPRGIAMLVELTEDPEEIRAQLKSLKLLKKNPIEAEDVKSICLDDGSRDLLRLLDGLCDGDVAGAIKSLRAISSSGDLIPSITPVYNRMRLAWYASLGNEGSAVARAIGAKDYAWRMANQAARRYGREALTDFTASLIRISMEERSGRGAGWSALETAVITLLSRAR